MHNDKKIVREIIDWAFLILDSDERYNKRTAKLLGFLADGSFVRTSRVARKVCDCVYQTESGTLYILQGAPNQDVSNVLRNAGYQWNENDASFGLGKNWFLI